MRDSFNAGYQPEGSRLTVEERRRLRDTVDQTALERFLAAAPEVPRVVVIAHFATEVYLEDLLMLQRIRNEAGEISDAELAEYERTMREPWPDDVSERSVPSEPGLRFVLVPHGEYVLHVQAPSDPILSALWEAIEPRPL